MAKKIKFIKSFTLIETIIYAVLISMIIGLSVFVIYQIINVQERLKSEAEVEEEMNFVLQKINWALAGASAVNQPLVNSTSTVLSLDKANFSQNPLVFDLSNKNARLSRAGGGAVILNSSNVVVDQLIFEHLLSSSTPESVRTTVNLKSGVYSKTVEMINYLKK